RLRDTSQFVLAELAALEREQAGVDARAVTLERELRGLMQSGTGTRGPPGDTGTPPGTRGHGDRPRDMGTSLGTWGQGHRH
ncbi:EH1L1 protein, partial [Calonectris borealis]|nr:EH1L1 protein [Calonectris borealis]